MIHSIQQSAKHEHHRDIIINGKKEGGLVICDCDRLNEIVAVGFNGFPVDYVKGTCDESIKKAAKLVADYYKSRH